ncbi:hypothetical protein [Streptomyces sp. ODS28]|uniref:hypothetical protein n=1 Tax=Streptomyces sp. ODS28 TaxID=3136688 RepID=UPI0031E5BEA8
MTEKLVVVANDPVKGTDKHHVAGTDKGGNPYAGTGDYAYEGGVTGGLSAFVRIGGKAVALVSSTSSLPSEQTAAGGKHDAKQGSGFLPPTADATTLAFLPTDLPVGAGTPNARAGSGVLTVGGTKVLLSGDAYDTCGPVKTPAGSTVTAKGQDFVTCSE